MLGILFISDVLFKTTKLFIAQIGKKIFEFYLFIFS